MVGELEVAALAADLRGEQHARAVGLGEPRRLPIALDERQALVEDRALHRDLALERVGEREHLARGAGDH
ncbi:MAG: hypothetical protein RL698_1503 [Pseudomonadota bacterium]